MNCKGNELARLVIPEDVIGCEHHGKIVWITTLTEGRTKEPSWNYSGTQFVFEIGGGNIAKGAPITQFGDKFLRPIGNPGPGEVDETLLWKKVPTPEQTKTKKPEKV